MQVRAHVFYSGTVQGVGFRYTARGMARGRGVTGFVRNLRDGRVELVAEGEEAEVDRFLADVAEAMSGYVTRADVRREPPTGQFAAFGVAFQERN
ncbi:MAG: acylphosphatase [Planctomycetes bacterium]|nr:acylphosphatase [Planctomycetota bacterium]